MTGHGGSAIVEYDKDEVMLIVHRIDKPSHAGVKEGRVADKGNDLLVGYSGNACR